MKAQLQFIRIILLTTIFFAGLTAKAQNVPFEDLQLSKLNKELGAGSFLIGYELNNGSNIQAGYNFFFNASYDGALIWNKITLKAGYSSTPEDLLTLSAGFTHTRNFIGYRADLTSTFSDGEMNLGINPKIGVDLLLGELYVGYNHFFNKDIVGLENQVTFSANINFAWTFMLIESASQTLKSL